MMATWRYGGRAYVLGHDVPHDNAMMAFEFIISRVMDPAELIPHLFASVRPGLAQKLKSGDLIVGGRNFAKGKAHVQAFVALKALGVGVMCESMPYNTYRALIGQGIPFLNGCVGIVDAVGEGDEVEADLVTGVLKNVTRGTEHRYSPLEPSVARIIRSEEHTSELQSQR